MACRSFELFWQKLLYSLPLHSSLDVLNPHECESNLTAVLPLGGDVVSWWLKWVSMMFWVLASPARGWGEWAGTQAYILSLPPLLSISLLRFGYLSPLSRIGHLSSLKRACLSFFRILLCPDPSRSVCTLSRLLWEPPCGSRPLAEHRGDMSNVETPSWAVTVRVSAPWRTRVAATVLPSKQGMWVVFPS